jgi:hypothetical protein
MFEFTFFKIPISLSKSGKISPRKKNIGWKLHEISFHKVDSLIHKIDNVTTTNFVKGVGEMCIRKKGMSWSPRFF